MVGNDIVDLRDRDADFETYRPGFDRRVFTPAERTQIQGAADPVRARWRLWAAKEASFKLARQLDARTIFSPRKFEASAARNAERASVVYGERHFVVALDETPDRIHAIAVADAADLSSVISRVAVIKAGNDLNESAQVRVLACETMSEHLEVPHESLEIRKNGGVPQLSASNQPTAFGVSLSHHGSWVAFACHQGEVRVV